ncbi:MAG TPA: DUF4157 domain-containing protein [Kofleriaceae bacterium]|jgi:hypothetical protein|nr:DUF4157 domain-containing protein [Kofleriaceae bacterium]
MHEREYQRGIVEHDAPDHDDVAPGRDNRTQHLDAPAHPVVSGLIQRRGSDGVADGAEHAVSAASSTSGHALPDTVMRKFESSLGADLGGVRVHTDATSNAAAEAVGAQAYTVGQDIHFAAGKYDPSSTGGEHLLAHEVAHTVQQQGGVPTRQNKLSVSSPADSLEVEADRAADAMVGGHAAPSISYGSGVQRRPIVDPDPNAVPDLATAINLTRHLATTFLPGPGGSTIKATLTARISGTAHTHGKASLSGNVSVTDGKPGANVSFGFKKQHFTVHMTEEGHLHAEQPVVDGSWHDLHGTVKMVSKGASLAFRLDGYVHVPGPHHSLVRLGIAIELDLTPVKRPRGVKPTGEPIRIPLKVLIPTIAAGGSGLLGTLAKGVLDGLEAEGLELVGL